MMTRSASPEQKKAMSTAIKATCLYGVVDNLYYNSFMLMYLAALGVPSDMILVYLALSPLVYMFTMVPAAHYSGRSPYVRNGMTGQCVSAAGFILLIGAPFFKPFGKDWLFIWTGMLANGVGMSLYVASWFPLTSTFVPDNERGRFFGTMRFFFQAVSILFALAVIAVLKRDSSLKVFQLFMCLALVGKIAGIIYLSRLPANQVESGPRPSLRESIWKAIVAPGFMPFCAYTFLLMLATGCCASLFALLAKGPLGLGDDEVILTGNLLMLGSMGGFYLGGKMVDRLGTKIMFLICHFSFGAILLVYLFRGFVPAPFALLFVGALGAVFGCVQASSGIALTSEMIRLTPADNKPVATAINQALCSAGVALSGLFSSQAIKFGLLNDHWTFAGHQMGQYDTLILCCSIMVTLLVVTLGLVPSVIKCPDFTES
ncbi:MAG: MFS transporter [Lentisphaeria bacterium]